MNDYEFYAILLSHFILYLIILLFIGICYFLLFRKYIDSVLDPLFLQLFFSVFGGSVVFLLYFTGNTTTYVFSSYLFTQIAFFIGLFVFRSYRQRIIKLGTLSNPLRISFRQIKACYIYFSSLLIVFQLFVYSQRGIPLLMQSRLELYTGGGGFGIFSRLIDVSTLASFYLFFELFFNRKEIKISLIYYLLFALNLIFLLLSGSKSSFLTVGFVLFCYLKFKNYKGEGLYLKEVIGKYGRRIFVYGFIFVILIIGVQSKMDNDTANPFFLFIVRLIHSGDVYWYAYPNNIYLQISNKHPFLALFNDFFGLFRIYHWKDMPMAIGIDLKQIFFPSDILSGPNARHNVFGLIYFGYFGAIIFSFILGSLLSFIRNKLQIIFRNNFFWGILYSALYVKATGMESDPMLTFTYFDNVIIFFPFLFVIFLLVYESFKFSYNPSYK